MVYKDKEKHKAYHNAYSKQWIIDNADHHRQWKREWVRDIRQKAIQALGGACVLCGYADVRVLEIDHIVTIRKSGHSINQVSLFLAVIRGETDNLQLLCANCHAIKTYEENRIE